MKIIIDYSCTILCLILLIPVILVLIILIKLSDKGPVLYKQRRIGENGKPFIMYKFRSMYTGAGNGIPLVSGRNDKRITPPGWFMRKHKLDEIPNFINVLKGEMSLVGPRPEQQYYVEKIVELKPDYILLLNIKPGITSWGQVKFGYASDVGQMIERLQFDFYYLENRSLWFDLKIVYYTFVIIFKGEGI